MPVADAAPDTLADLPRLLRDAEGFADVVQALRAGRAGTIDGAWGSSAALSTAAVTLSPKTAWPASTSSPVHFDFVFFTDTHIQPELDAALLKIDNACPSQKPVRPSRFIASYRIFDASSLEAPNVRSPQRLSFPASISGAVGGRKAQSRNLLSAAPANPLQWLK